LVLLLIGAIPARGRFGNGPIGIIGILLIVVLILALTGSI
jgi:hypothetical protein